MCLVSGVAREAMVLLQRALGLLAEAPNDA